MVMLFRGQNWTNIRTVSSTGHFEKYSSHIEELLQRQYLVALVAAVVSYTSSPHSTDIHTGWVHHLSV